MTLVSLCMGNLLIQVLIVTELSRRGMKPQDVRHLLSSIESVACTTMQEAAVVYGVPERHKTLQRYAALYPSKEGVDENEPDRFVG